MSATDELRKLLDERGVEHYDNDINASTGVRITEWENGGKRPVRYEEWRSGTIRMDAGNITPTQAIAATLEAGTCRNVHEPPKNTTFWPAPHFKCSECGATHVSMEYVYFCPNCGRRVVEE